MPKKPRLSEPTRAYGVEEARQELPSLLDRAAAGGSTVITRHGHPIAAVVPIALAPRRTLGLTALCGSGTGLWTGEDALAKQRDEWQ